MRISLNHSGHILFQIALGLLFILDESSLLALYDNWIKVIACLFDRMLATVLLVVIERVKRGASLLVLNRPLYLHFEL